MNISQEMTMRYELQEPRFDRGPKIRSFGPSGPGRVTRLSILCALALLQNPPTRADTEAAPTPSDDDEWNLFARLQPVPLTAKLEDPDYNIWCGSAVRGEDGRYHMFYSRWPRRLGHLAWVTHSEVARAVSDSPFGPWKHQ